MKKIREEDVVRLPYSLADFLRLNWLRPTNAADGDASSDDNGGDDDAGRQHQCG